MSSSTRLVAVALLALLVACSDTEDDPASRMPVARLAALHVAASTYPVKPNVVM